jgi:hypothetical protein
MRGLIGENVFCGSEANSTIVATFDLAIDLYLSDQLKTNYSRSAELRMRVKNAG